VDEVASTVVQADDPAREFIRANGGAVYAWIDDSGFMKVGFQGPEGVEWIELRGDGFVLLQDPDISPPRADVGWRLALRRWPRRHLQLEDAPDGPVDWIAVLATSPWP
jgi:hypothetical protein